MVARLFGWLVALGLLVSVALVAPVETAGELFAKGGALIALSRLAAMSGTFLLLVTMLLIARIPALESSLGQDRLVAWHRRLGPWVLGLISVHVVAVRARLRPAGEQRRPARVLAAGHHLPRHPHGRGRLRPAAAGGRDLLPVRAPQDALRDLVGGAPLHLPRRVPVVLAPALDGRALPGSPPGTRLVGRPVAVHRRHRHRVPLPAAPGAQPAPPARGGRRAPGGAGRGERACCAAGAWTACPSPAGSSCSGASCARACGGRRTPTRCRRCPPPPCCASP